MNPPKGQRRFGRFFIPFQMIEEQPDGVMGVMQRVIILDTRIDYSRNGVEYQAWSPNFDEVGEQLTAPEYEFTLRDNVCMGVTRL